MRILADAAQPPVVVPVVVVLVHVHVALVVPAVESGYLYKVPSISSSLEYSQD